MTNISTTMLVAAVALIDDAGRVLMQKRRKDSVHGGLWEFPGGKVEPGETPESAAMREIEEELGVALDGKALAPVTFASGAAHPAGPPRPLVILLYRCMDWRGVPQCLEADAIAWFAPEEIAGLAMPPLDYPLARALLN